MTDVQLYCLLALFLWLSQLVCQWVGPSVVRLVGRVGWYGDIVDQLFRQSGRNCIAIKE